MSRIHILKYVHTKKFFTFFVPHEEFPQFWVSPWAYSKYLSALNFSNFSLT